MNFLLEELGWKLCPEGDFHEWDGMLDWFMSYVKAHPDILDNKYIGDWYKTAVKVLKVE
jgi:hypothetical protein